MLLSRDSIDRFWRPSYSVVNSPRKKPIQFDEQKENALQHSSQIIKHSELIVWKFMQIEAIGITKMQ